MNNNILENSAIQAHIAMLQGIINRMAENSANCKYWTIGIVTALLTLSENDKIHPINIWIYFIPIGLFYILNCYYLGLERLCILSQKNFLKNIQNDNNNYTEKLFKIEELKESCVQICSTFKAVTSISTTPFYLIVAIFVYFFKIYQT